MFASLEESRDQVSPENTEQPLQVIHALNEGFKDDSLSQY